MPLIVVVETEQRYVERIVEALSPQGWEVLGVEDSAAALERRADETASLLVVNGLAPDAGKLVAAFARRSGGPGAVVLVPEDADDGVHELGADEVLQKPFTDQEIRLAVRRCLVGLSSSAPAPPEEPVAPPPKSSERLTSEDLFGDMVSELESVFKFGPPAADKEETKAAPAEISEETEAEEEIDLEAVSPVVEEPAEEEVRAGEIEAEAVAVDEEAEEEPAVELAEPQKEREAPEEREQPPEEEPPVEGEPEEKPVEELAAEEAAEAIAVEEAVEADLRQAPPAPPPAPRRDPTAALEERIRQAAEEGKRLAAKGARPRQVGRDLGRSTDTLLRQVLEGIGDDSPRKRGVDRRATEDEVDELVGSVVPKEEPRKEQATSGADPEADASDAGEAPFLEVLERDDEQREEDEYRTRLKLIWAIILIIVLGLLAFVLVRGMGEDPDAGTPVPPAVEEQQPDSEAPIELQEEGTEGDSEAAGEPGRASEESLEQELEAQRRQLREEIAKSQAAAEEDGP